MKTTLNINDNLLNQAMMLTGISQKTLLVQKGLEALVVQKNAERLANLGGIQPKLQTIPRRKNNL